MSSYAVFEALGIYKASALAGKRKDKTQSFPESDNIKINLPTTYQKGNVRVVGASQLFSHKYPFQYSSKDYQEARAEPNTNVMRKMTKYRLLQVSVNLMLAGS